MAGPLPPNVGGMSTVIGDLGASKLAEQVELLLFNTAKTTREGRTVIEAVASKLRLWFDWVSLIKSKPETIAHIHTCSGFTFFLDSVLVCLARLLGVPVVLHMHGGKFSQFLDSLNPLAMAIVRRVFRLSRFVIVLSDSWMDELQKRLGALDFKVVANGVPISPARLRSTRPSDKVNILFLGNLTKNKGIFDLIDVMCQIDGAVLHLVGGEERPGVLEEVNLRIKSPNLDGKVKLHGVKSGQDKQRLMADADIFALPSYAEGLPVSILEAMACGLPVVASDVGGIPSVITHEREGFLIAAGNHDQLRSALKRLVDDTELRLQMGEAGRTRCQSHFSVDIAADKLVNLYWEIFPEYRNCPNFC